jgi:hypothetical protein
MLLKNNKYPHNLTNSSPKKLQKASHGTSHSKQWVTFTCFRPQTRKINNLLKNMETQVALKTCNTLWKHLKLSAPKWNTFENSGVMT